MSGTHATPRMFDEAQLHTQIANLFHFNQTIVAPSSRKQCCGPIIVVSILVPAYTATQWCHFTRPRQSPHARPMSAK
eukprot:scaffold144295_cov35-Prasinocladus_malaysianus.AAC.1